MSCSLRLTVRTPGFHPGNRSSILLGSTNHTGSSRGRTFGFGPENGGSNPSPVTNKYGLVVQLVRILACHARGREFESRPVR